MTPALWIAIALMLAGLCGAVVSLFASRAPIDDAGYAETWRRGFTVSAVLIAIGSVLATIEALRNALP